MDSRGTAVEFFHDDREGIPECILTHKNVQVTIAGERMHRMESLAELFEEVEGTALAFGQKTDVAVAGHENEPSISLRRLGVRLFC